MDIRKLTNEVIEEVENITTNRSDYIFENGYQWSIFDFLELNDEEIEKYTLKVLKADRDMFYWKEFENISMDLRVSLKESYDGNGFQIRGNRYGKIGIYVGSVGTFWEEDRVIQVVESIKEDFKTVVNAIKKRNENLSKLGIIE